MKIKPLKPKKCRACGNKFQPWNSLQTCCSTFCSIAYDKQKKAKKAAKDLARDRAEFKLNDKKTQKNLAQKYFNQFIRLRDAKLPCISCGTTKDVVYCAGHYRSRGAVSALAFNEFNTNKQCNKRCNLELSGNIGEYRIALVKKIGVDKVEWLEGPHEPIKYQVSDYVAIKKKYLEIVNRMVAENSRELTSWQ